MDFSVIFPGGWELGNVKTMGPAIISRDKLTSYEIIKTRERQARYRDYNLQSEGANEKVPRVRFWTDS